MTTGRVTPAPAAAEVRRSAAGSRRTGPLAPCPRPTGPTGLERDVPAVCDDPGADPDRLLLHAGRRATRAIRERPAAARDRAIPGHREGDSIAGSRNSYIATPVERQSRYVLLAKVPDKNTDGVVTALVRQVQHLPRELRESLTRDRGKELADPSVSRLRPTSRFASAIPTAPGSAAPTRTPTGCCDSTSPKALTCAVARELNERQRKTLNDHSPDEKFAECVAAIS